MSIPSFICKNHIPFDFLSFFGYVINLQFEEKPDYNYLRQLLKSLAYKNNIDLDYKFYDWNLKITMIKNFP